MSFSTPWWFRTEDVSLSTTWMGTILHVWGYDGQNSSCSVNTVDVSTVVIMYGR